MNLADFKIGDAVVLASGGPTMRVIGFSPNGRVWCEWDRPPLPVEEASFVPETLRRAT